QILVLRDYSENVKRMLEMIKKIDVTLPSEYDSEVIPIKYAIASDIANALNSLSSGGGGGTTVGGTGAGSAGTAGGGRSGTGFGGSGYGSSLGGYGRPGYGGYGGTYGGGMGYGGVSPYGTTTPVGTAQPGAPGSSFTQRLQNIINRASAAGEMQ